MREFGLFGPEDDWRRLAECRRHDPEMWSIKDGKAGEYFTAENIRAMDLCRGTCPVRHECDRAAQNTPEDRRMGVILGGRAYNSRGAPRQREGARRRSRMAGDTLAAEPDQQILPGHASVA